jgi:predicted hydrocarbon binding protein
LRIGGNLWRHLLNEAAIAVKAQAAILRGLPTALRRKRALDLLARLLSDKQGDSTVHTLDPDLIFVDHASPTTLGQSDSVPVCFVTLGMIRECLYWVTGYEHDIEEISCRASGAKDCEFKITIGG